MDIGGVASNVLSSGISAGGGGVICGQLDKSEPTPTIQGKPLELFQQQSSFLSLAYSHPHEARAQELEALGFTRYADRIRKCSQPSGPFPRRTCKLRFCPTCSQRQATKHKKTARLAIAMMAIPVQVLFSLSSLPNESLREFDDGHALPK
jgi:hypothetical protein